MAIQCVLYRTLIWHCRLPFENPQKTLAKAIPFRNRNNFNVTDDDKLAFWQKTLFFPPLRYTG